jgi:hypothetical protein
MLLPFSKTDEAPAVIFAGQPLPRQEAVGYDLNLSSLSRPERHFRYQYCSPSFRTQSR